MPVLDPKLASNPYINYGGPVQPNYNFSDAGFDKIGGADTWLSRLTGNFYDKSFIPEMSQTNQRYYNQGVVNTHASNLLKLGLGVGTGALAAANAITSLNPVGLAFGMASGRTVLQTMQDNPLNQIYEGAKHMMETTLPTFVREDFDKQGVLGQLGSGRIGEFLTRNNESLQFIVESFAGGGGMAALKVGARAANALSKVRPMYKALTSLEGPNIAGLANKIDWATTSSVLAANEAMMEAKDSYDSNVAKFTAERLQGKNNFTDQQITESAQRAADNVFWQNAATLMVTNSAFMKILSPLMKPAEKMTRGNKHGFHFANGNYQMPKHASAGATAFEKFLYDKGNSTGMVLKGMLENVFSEGLEESLQHSIQEVNKVQDALHSDTSFLGSSLKYLKTLPEVINLSDPERLNATLLGSILGSAQVGIAGTMGLGAAGEAKSYREERERHLQSLQSTYTDFTKSTIFAKNDDTQATLKKVANQDGTVDFIYQEGSSEQKINEKDFALMAQKNGLDPNTGGTFTIKGQFKFDEEGNLIRDPVKMAQFINDAVVHGEMDDLIDMEALRGAPDKRKLQLYKEQKLATLAEAAFDAGAADLLYDKFEQLQTASPEELLTMGIDPDEAATEIPKLVKHVQELEKLYLTHVNTPIIASNSKDDNVLNRSRQKYIYSLGSRMLSMDSLLSDIDSEYMDKKEKFVSQFSEEDKEKVDEAIKRVADKQYNEDKIEELFNTRESLTAQVIEADLRGEVEKKKQLEQGIEEADMDIQKKLAERKAFSSEDVSRMSEYADSSVVEELAQLMNKAAHVKDARETLGKTFDKVLDNKKGFQFYKDIRNKTSNDPTTIYDSSIKNFRIHSQLTAEMYDFYEDRSVPKLHFQDKVDTTSHEFYSEMIDRFVEWYESTRSNPSSTSLVDVATSLKQLVSEIIAKQPRLYQESSNKLANLIKEAIQEVNELQAPFLAEFNKDGGAGDPGSYMDDLNEFDPERADILFPLYKDYKLGEDIKAGLGTLFTNSEDIIKTLYSLISDPRVLLTEKELRVKAMDQLTEPASRILLVSNYRDGEIDPDYSDNISPEYEIQKLNVLLHRILPFKGPEFNEVKQKIKDLIEALTIVLDKVNENLHNRDLINIKENALYEGSYLTSIGISEGVVDATNPVMEALLSLSSPETMDLIANASKTNPSIAIKAIEVIAKQDPALMNQVINLRLYDMLGVVTHVVNDKFNNSTVTEDEIVSFTKSPVRLFKHILEKLVRSDEFQTRYKNADIKEFLNTFDIIKLIESRPEVQDSLPNPRFVDRSKSALDNQGMDTLINVYLSTIALNSLLIHTKSTVDNVDALDSLLKYAAAEKAGTKKPAPSIAQERVIMQLANWLSSTPTPSTQVNANVAALKAPPGAGKSLVVTPLALRLSGITPDKVITAASTATAAENIARAVGNTVSNTMETLSQLLETGNIPENVEVLVVDEVGPAKYELIDRLSKALSKFNRENTNRVPLKMLYIFDPNQVTAGYKDSPDIESIGYNTPYGFDTMSPEEKNKVMNGEYEIGMDLVFTQNIYDLTPLSTTYRSDVAQIQDLFGAFRTKDQVTSTAAATSVDPRVSTKDILGTYVQLDNKDLKEILKSSVLTNPNRSRVVIVGSESKKLAYSNELKASGITEDAALVLTVSEAQGLTFDEVYVDVATSESPADFPNLFDSPKSYNKYMYTAISRAAKFAYVANVTGTNSIDTTIPEKTARAASTKTTDYDQYVAIKKQEVELLKSLTKDVETAVPEAVQTPVTPTATVDEDGVEVPVTKQAADITKILQGVVDDVAKYQDEYASHFTFNATNPDKVDHVNVTEIIKLLNRISEEYNLPIDNIERIANSFKQNITLKDGHKLTFGSIMGGAIGQSLDKKNRVSQLGGLIVDIIEHFKDTGETQYLTSIGTPKVEAMENPVLDAEVDNYIDKAIDEMAEEAEKKTKRESLVTSIESSILSSPNNQDELTEQETFDEEEALPIEDDAFNYHHLRYPENYSFSDIPNSNGVQVGDELVLVRDTYTSNPFEKKERIMVLRPEGNGKFRKVAVLSDAEKPEVEKAMGFDFSKLTPIEFYPEGQYFVTHDKPLGKQDAYKSFVGPGSQGVTYRYDYGNPTIQLSSDKDALNLFNRWATGMFGADFKQKITNYREIEENPAEFLSMKVFNSPKSIEKYFEGKRQPRIPPKAHVPYMFISGVQVKGDKQALTPQYIRLTSNVLNESTTIANSKDYTGNNVPLTMGTLKEFLALVKEFEQSLAKHKNLGMYSRARMGVPITDASGKTLRDNANNPFHVFHSLVKALSEQYQQKGKSPIKILGHGKQFSDIKGLSENIINMFPDISPANVSDKLLLLAARIDSMQHFGDKHMIEKGVVKPGTPRNFNGHAQIVLNKLASSNFFITLPGSKDVPGATPLILRDYEVTKLGDGSSVENMVGKRLLGPVSAVRKNFAYNPLLKSTLIGKLERYAKTLENANKTDSVRYKLVQEVLKKQLEFDLQNTRLTTEQLSQLLNGKDNEGNYTHISEGFGLRAPISVSQQQEDGTISYSRNIGTTFKSVSPTVISLSKVKFQPEQKEALETPKESVTNFIQKNGGTKTVAKLVEEVTNNYTKEEVSAFLKRMKTTDLQKAISEYLISATSPATVRQLGLTLRKTIANVTAMIQGYDTDAEMLDAMYQDTNYWKEDSKTKFGPRDTLRLVIALKLFPQIAGSEKLTRLVALFSQNRWYRVEEFIDMGALDKEKFISTVQNLVDAATRVAKQRNIPATAPKVVNEDGSVNIEEAVEYIAEYVGSKIRYQAKKDPEAIPVENTIWAQRLSTLVHNRSNAEIVTYLRTNEESSKRAGFDLEKEDRALIGEAYEYVLENNILPIRNMLRTSEMDNIGPLLTDQEATELYERLLPATNIPFIDRIFRKRKGEAFRIISMNHMQHQLGKNNWGLFKDGIVHVARHSSGKVGSKVVKHEILHKIIWEYLAPHEREMLWQLGISKFGNLSPEALEERIVEEFTDNFTTPTGIWESVKQLYYKIMRFLGFTYLNLTSLETFFSTVENGYYSGKGRFTSMGIERNLKISKDWKVDDNELVLQGWGALESYLLFEDLLFQTFDEVYHQPRTGGQGRLLSFEEAIEETFFTLSEMYENPERFLGEMDSEDIAKVRNSIYPILNTNGRPRKEVIDEYFPQNREAERLAMQIGELRQRYEALLDEKDTLDMDEDSEEYQYLDKAVKEIENELDLKEEMYESELRDPGTKLTGRVKQRLGAIQYMDKTTVKRAEFSKTFNALLTQGLQLDHSSTENFLTALIGNLSKAYPVRGSADRQRTVGAALAKHVRDTAVNIRNLEEKREKSLVFRKDSSSLLEYLIYSKDFSETSDVTRSQALQNPKKYTVVERLEGETLHEFALRVTDELEQYTYDEIRNAYYLYEENAFVSSLVSAVNSLRPNKPHVGMTYYRYGIQSDYYFPTKASGPSYILDSDINASVTQFIEKARDYMAVQPEHNELFSSSFLEDLPLPESTPEKEMLIKKRDKVNQFLDLIKINKGTRIVEIGDTSAEVDRFYYHFYYFIQNLRSNFLAPPSEEDISKYGESEYRPALAIISDESTIKEMLIEKLYEKFSGAAASVSYKRADGKSAYRFVDASFQSSVLNYIDNAVKAKLKGEVPEGVVKPLHIEFRKTSKGTTLTTASPLLVNNIFVNNNTTSEIREFIDHDGMKTAGQEGWAKYLKAETPSDYHRRNFAFGFLARFYKTKGVSYIQFLPNPPQNRSSIQGAEVSYKGIEGIKTLVRHIVKSQLNRPTPESIGFEGNEAYVKNYKKIYLPGLNNKQGMELTRDELLQMGMERSKVKKPVNAAYEAENVAIEMFLNHITKQSKLAADEFMSDFQGKEIKLSESALLYAAKQMGISRDKYTGKKEQAKARKVILADANLTQEEKDQAVAELNAKYAEPYRNILEQVLVNFYGNFAVNQYGLGELVYSDQALYSNKENLSKRIQVATATGDIGLINPNRGGMKPTSRVGVIDDISLGIQMDLAEIRDDSYEDAYDSTDGQGFVTPEFYERMTTSYSIESQLDVTLKPVYYAIHANGEVVALKYSLVVLTDQLTEKYPHLAKLREDMRNNMDENGNPDPLDQAVFNSAVKVGNPKTRSQMAEKLDAKKRGGAVQYSNKGKMVSGFSPKSILTIHNQFLRLQLNPAKEVDGTTRNASQITSFINSNGLNQVESSKLYGYNSLIIEAGLRKIMRELKVNAKGGLSKAAELAIRERLINLTDGLPGAEDVNSMLSYKLNGKYGVSMNIPLLAKRVVSALSSNITRETVGFRFPGSKLVLQAQVGISENLQWKDKDGYTEVILPESYRKLVKEGDVLTDGLVGFRIPSTNYHSALALKVKGFYPTPPGSKGNIIIAPSLIVYYHGSDYDIDTLFLMRKQSHSGDTLNLNEILNKYGMEANPLLNFEEGDVYGFKTGKEDKINNVGVAHYLYGAISVIEAAMNSKRSEITKAKGERRSALISQIEEMENDYYQIVDSIQQISKNAIVHTFSTNLRNIKNRKDLLTPISFARAAKVKSEVVKELKTTLPSIRLLLKSEGLNHEVENLEQLLLDGDMDAMEQAVPGSETSTAVRRLLVRYGVRKQEDSVMEMQAKRNMERANVSFPEFPSKDLVNQWIYPIGQLNDYLTQRAIHSNTYSGARLTGISANTGKMLAYLFEATPATVVIDTVKGTRYEGEKIRSLVNSYRMETLASLMEKHPRFQIAEKEDVMIKPEFRLKIDNKTMDRFSRFELDMETGEPKVLPTSNDTISVFETIDTIINLAIDNVKEQKLFTYGITSSNGNAFFTMLAMGVPLNTVVRFFTSPLVSRLSKNRRISEPVLNDEAKVFEGQLEGLANSENLESVLSYFMGPEQVAKVMKKKNYTDNITDLIISSGSINTDVLDMIYKNESLPEFVEPIANLIALRTLSKLSSMGEEMFASAQLFSLLRGMPSDMSGVQYLNNKPKEFAKFDYAATVEDMDQEAYITKSLDYIKENDPRYRTASDKKKYLEDVKTSLMGGRSSALINTELTQMFDRKFSNSMLYSTLRNSISPNSKSVFENVSPLSIPHVYSAWKTLNFLKGVVERSFAMHNPLLKSFADKLIERTELFTSYNKYELVEKVATQFFSFITSNLDISIGGTKLNLNESKAFKATSTGVLYGTEAWASKFIDEDLLKAKSEDESSNRFLQNLEVVVSPNGARSLRMFSDKIRDPKIKEGIRADYVALYRNPSTRQLALDVFKYAILAEGLLYSRSSLALVFPASFIAAYSSQFENRLTTFMPDKGAKSLANLDQVSDLFAFQFLRNNVDVAPYVRKHKPKVTFNKPVGDFTKQMYSGIERELGEPFYFDLKFEGMPSESAKKFIKRFGTELYAKIETPDSTSTYYRQVTNPISSRYYDINIEEDLTSRYSFDPLVTPTMIIPSHFIGKDGILNDDNASNKYEVGDTIYTFERGHVRPTRLSAYEVTAVTKAGAKVSRKVTNDIKLNNSENNNVYIKYPALQRAGNFTTINHTSSRVKAIAASMQEDNSVAIVSGPEVGDNVINVVTNGNIGDYQKLVTTLQNLDPSKTYFVQDELLAEVPEEFQEDIARALQSSIGYADRYTASILNEEDDISLFYKLKAASKNRPHFRAGEDSSDAYSMEALSTIPTEGVARLPYKDLPVFTKTNPGDVIYMGMRGSIPQFAYVEGITTANDTPTHLVISLIPSNVAAKMDKDNYSGEEYEGLLKEFEIESNC